MSTKTSLQPIPDYFQLLRSRWVDVIGDKRFITMLLATLLALIPLYFFLVPYLQFVEQRQGIVLNDFILNLLTPRDLSTWIFAIQYTSALVVLIYLIPQPWALIRCMQTFIVLQYLRNVCLYFVPLAAPTGIVPLHDPILELIAYGNKPLLQDLFFSGHTAACFIFVLMTKENFYLFIGFRLITALMIYFLLVQHCHYTIDIIGGIVFAIIAYQLVIQFWKKLNLPTNLSIKSISL